MKRLWLLSPLLLTMCGDDTVTLQAQPVPVEMMVESTEVATTTPTTDPAIVATEPADRLDISARIAALPVVPPEPLGILMLPFAPAGMTGCDEMNFYRAQWGLPERFGDYPRTGSKSKWGLGWRESNCRNDVSTYCCYGYWQNYISSHLSAQSLYRQPIQETCQAFSKWDIYGNDPLQKQKQACVTAIVYAISGLSPWRL